MIRAVRFCAAAPDTSTTEVTDVDLPEPGPGELTVDVRFAGVNYKDVMARRGDAAYVTSWPYAPGLEVAGTVRALGAGVDGFQVGEPVVAYTDAGGLAEVAVAKAELTVSVPDRLDLAKAAAAPGALTAAALLLDRIARFRPGDHLLVHSAAGAVGAAVAQLARLGGVGHLVGVVGSESRQGPAHKLGYDAVFVRGPGLAQEVLGHTGGVRFDLVLDPQGTTMLDADLEMVAPAGKVVLFGNAGGGAYGELPPTGRLYAGNVAIGGFSLAALSRTAPALLATGLRQAVRHLADGDLQPEITLVEGLEAVPEAHQALAEGRARGKQIVRVSHG
ncbi:MAG: NADPH:quinone reductase [Frankiales bacterium]|nr:NADPH:quinone reductase [Frankiales bacterium]